MSDQPAPEIELLRAAYVAFNARDIDAALALMTPDVAKAESVQRRFCPWVWRSSRLLDGAMERDLSARRAGFLLLGGGRAHFGRCAWLSCVTKLEQFLPMSTWVIDSPLNTAWFKLWKSVHFHRPPLMPNHALQRTGKSSGVRTQALLNYGMIRAKIREGTRKWFLRFWWGIGTSPNFR